ncbi:MAG: YdbH domain-containing protein [Alphaproteobacteria bacterium]|nr:YdbH domain-containing protein [Alphaproteobacteria bacterium]
MTFPLRSLLLRQARLTLNLPQGPVRVEGTLRARFAAGVAATGSLSLHHALGEARLSVDEARASQGPDGAWSLALTGALALAGQQARAEGPLALSAAFGKARRVAVTWTPPRANLPGGLTLQGLSLRAEAAQAPGTAPTPSAPTLSVRLAAEQGSGDGWAVARPQIDLDGSPNDLRLTLASATQDQPLTVHWQRGAETLLTANGTVIVDWVAPILRAAGLPLYGSGQAVTLLSLRLPDGPLAEPATWDGAVANGVVSLALKGLRWGDEAAMDSVNGRLVFQGAANRGRVRVPEGLRIAGLTVAEPIRARLPPLLAPLLRQPVFAAYGGPLLGSPEIAVERASDGTITAAGELALRLGNPVFAVRTEGGLRATLPPAGPPRLAADALTLRLVDTRLGKMRASGEFAFRDLEATPGNAHARLTLAARSSGTPDPSVRFAEADLDATLALDWRGERLTLHLAPGSRARLLALEGRTLRLTKPSEKSGTTELRLAAGDDQRLTIDLARGGVSGALRFAPVTGGFTARDVQQAAHGAKFRLSGFRVDLAPHSHRLRVGDGEIRVPNLSLVADRIRADLRLGQESGQGKGHDAGQVVIGRIRHAVARPAVVPLRLALNLTEAGDRLGFAGRLTDQGNRIAFTVKGAHDLATGTGSVRVRAPLLFLPNVLQPADLFPSAANLVLDANAAVTLDGAARWSAKGLTQHGRLSVSVDHVTTAELSVSGAVASVELASLVPPATAGPQRITIGRLNVGVPLSLGVIAFDMRSLQDVRLHLEQFDLFGGRVRAKPLRLNTETLSFDTVLEIDGIDLSQALRFAEFGEFRAEGVLAGRIPIVARDGEMLVRGARLETTKPGRIRYTPIAVDHALKQANEATDLVVQALKDFRYDRFAIDLDEQDAEELTIGLHFSGRSARPLTRDGITLDPLPIEINIKLEGPMRQILNDAVDDTSDITSFSWTEEGSQSR